MNIENSVLETGKGLCSRKMRALCWEMGKAMFWRQGTLWRRLLKTAEGIVEQTIKRIVLEISEGQDLYIVY